MNIHPTLSLRIVSLLYALLLSSVPRLCAQAGNSGGLAIVEGQVCDAQDQPVVGAALSLLSSDSSQNFVATTDAQGRFRFASVPLGTYTLHANRDGFQQGSEGPFDLHAKVSKSLSLHLKKLQIQGLAKDTSSAIEFSDEPAFTVAGVTDTTALGGHGSNQVLPSSNALVKDTASLAREGVGQPAASESGASKEVSLRSAIAREDSADLHAQLAEIEESEGRSLEAVKEYQRAAEMQPTEPHLFAWGAELLLHRAFAPAIEVFSKGHRLFPQSNRMLLGLGAARFAEGSREQAGKIFLEACDLDPADSTPYLFLGRLQATESIEPAGWTDRMKRFASLHPENAMAHYLYGAALAKHDPNHLNFDLAEAELKSAIRLDPQLGNAYLQLGILRSQRDDFPGAIDALQKAVETTPLPDEAHYRLAQVYRRMGEADQAGKEIAQYKEISEQKSKDAERERHEIQQFVYTLRGQNTPAQQSFPEPH